MASSHLDNKPEEQPLLELSLKKEITPHSRLQALYRGRRDRKKHLHVQEKFIRGKVLSVSNEPDIDPHLLSKRVDFGHHSLSLKRAMQAVQGSFTFIGCSHTRNLEYILYLCPNETILASASDGYRHTPKLFIIDININIQNIWKDLKSFFTAINYCKFHEQYKEYCQHVESLGLSSKGHVQFNRILTTVVTLINSSEIKYQFLRNVVLKATMILDVWPTNDDNMIFDYIKKHSSGPIIVYASNIAEFTLMPTFISEKNIHLRIQQVQCLFEKINSLSPIISIHTRTCHQCYLGSNGGIRPNFTLVYTGRNTQAQLNNFNRPDFLRNTNTQDQQAESEEEVIDCYRCSIM